MSTVENSSGNDIVDRLGVTPIINAGGPNTKHSGSRPRQAAMDAMQAMSEVFVNIDELLLAAGEEIATLVGAEAATVTSGASGGLVVQAAAAISKGDPEIMTMLVHPLHEQFCCCCCCCCCCCGCGCGGGRRRRRFRPRCCF